MTEAAVGFAEALRFWVKLGFINFGGPAGQIAIMHRELVERKRWIPEEQFLRALNFCTILPGPEAQQLATYVGWRLHGVGGGVVAGSFFVVPSIFLLLFLSWLAAAHAQVPAIAGLLYGVQPVVIAIVVEAVFRIGRRALRHPVLLVFAAAAFAALYLFRIPFPLVVVAAAAAGLLMQGQWPQVFQAGGPGTSPTAARAAPAAEARGQHSYPPLQRSLRVGAVFLALWAIPVGALWAWRGPVDVLVQEALFFTQAAFVTFGGAYAVLAFVADVAVNHYGWLDAEQMVQGLALAESTPGPLIMVNQFVGFMGAWRHHGEFDPLVYGIFGGLVTTYVTFLPSFLLIFLGAPYVEALAANRRLQAALVGVTAAVVGVILNLAVFFGTRVLLPGGALDGFALALAAASYLALWRLHAPVPALVLLGALAGMARTLGVR